MKKHLSLLIVFLALVCNVNAQVMEWYTYWGSNVAGNQIQPVRMVVDNAGDIYIAALFGGNSVQILDQTFPSQSGTDLGDATILKMTPDKEIVWSRKLVNSGEAAISDMIIDNEGNLVVAGTFKGMLQADENDSMAMEDPSGYAALSIFVIRYDSNGNVLKMWQLPAEEATVESVTADGSGNIIISGTFGSEMSFDPANLNGFVGNTQYWNQMYVAKYSKDGALIWVKYQQTAEASFVNAFSKADADGNIFVSGAFTGSTTLAGTNLSTQTAINDLFLLKYTPLGEESWVRHIKGSRSDAVTGIEISPIGEVAVMSTYYSEDITIDQSTDTLQNGFATKEGEAKAHHIGIFTFDKDNGDYRWWYSFGQGSTVGGGGAVGSSIRVTDEGVWYVVGTMSSRFGDLYSHSNFGGNARSGLRTVDGIWMQHNTNGGGDGLYFVLTRDGKLASVARPGGTQTEVIKDIALSPDKNHVYMLLEIRARANVIYTCPDNMFDSFTDLHNNFPERKEMYTLLQVYCPEDPVENKYTNTYVGFTSTLLGKYKLPEIVPNQLPEFTVGEEYNQPLSIASPAGKQQFYQLLIPEELNFYNNALIGTISTAENLCFGVIATDSTANPGPITYYAQDPNGESIRGLSRNVRYMPLNAKEGSSVKNPLVGNVTFYPTVTSNVLNIQTSETNYVVHLYNQVGQLIGKYSNPISIDVNNLPAGLYHAQLKSMTGAVETAKFIVK
ncbi:MAG TPA: T9SS type A sorting domain-containing protein [Bacteroidales bacterium]|nr:T9SS type A sorting domain-containing protein [Bacteroidales bacterium]HOQ57628.1 T9SS type A sorting domain-containing protein [Bacteroidales bacterium]HPL05661.1 T9SS type A sorting domain-containing protein [Bacteroidales bacterium]